MEQIMMKRIDGVEVPLQSKAAVTKITKAEQRISLTNEDIVTISIESPYPQVFSIGDKITVFGREYTMNLLPTVKRKGAHLFSYDVTFEGPQYELSRAQYEVSYDTTGADVQGDDLMGDLRRFMQVLIVNINRVTPGKWQLGECPDTDVRNLAFSCENCLAVVQRLCTEFGYEFEIEQVNGVNILHIRKTGSQFPFKFQYGKGRGLYELVRQNVSNTNIVTRLKVFGGNRNLGSKYRNTRLCLPGKKKSQSYLEDPEAIEMYGIWEGTKNFDEIYPKRIGKVTGLGDSVFKFVDSEMFDLNEKEADGITTKHLIEGVAAKIKFNTGMLAGYEFDIHAYDHATRTFTLKKETDERGLTFPSETSEAFQIHTQDEYSLLDINLPDQYVLEAEEKLPKEGQTYLKKNSQPQVQYSLSITETFLENLVGEGSVGNIFMVGDYIDIEDTELHVDKTIRITGFSRDLLRPYKYTLTIADTYQKSIYSRIISDLNEIDRIIQINDLTDPSKARRKWQNGQEILGMIFDPEGDYYSEKIKPESIETLMLSVGSKSMQFILQNTLIEANYNGNRNSVRVTGGVLSHYTIEENIRNWNMASGTTTLTGDSSAFYIYAKCAKGSNAGSFIFSTTQIKVDSDPNFYHFWVGVLHSVTDGVRAISLTYGSTTINGKFIRTGQIESSDGTCYLDLDGNRLNLGDTNSGLSWNLGGDRKLRLRGTFVQSQDGKSESGLGAWRGVYNASTTYYPGDEVSYTFNGTISSYIRIGTTGTLGIVPTNTAYWQVTSQGSKGANGNNAAQIYIRSQFQPTTPTGTNPSGWSTNPSTLQNNFGVLWRSDAIKDSAGNLVGTWTTPVLSEPYTSNMLERFIWTTGSGTLGHYSMNGNTAENRREILATPFGFKDVIWRGICDGVLNANTQNTDSDGGFNFTASGIDATKRLRVSCWMLKTSSAGTMYLGCGGSSTLNISNNTANTNPYFFSGQPPTLNKWYLLVGYINGSGDTDTVNNPLGGFYDPDTGTKVGSTFVTFKNKAGITTQMIRAYNYYCKQSGAEVRFWQPRIDVVDGREPGISELLKKGAKGERGLQGPALVPKGAYVASKVYYGDEKTVDVVKHGGVWYKALTTAGSFSNVAPPNAAKWEPFGGNFECVATDTLLSDDSYLGNWRIKGGKIVSTIQSSSTKIEMDASLPRITVSSSRTGGQESSGSVASTLMMDASSGLIEARSNNGVSYITANGIFSNSANTNAVSAVTGTTRKAAVVGLGYGTVNKSDWQNENFLAGVYGVASNSGSAPAYGGYFRDLFVAGLILHRQAYDNTNDATYYLPNYASMVIGYSSKRTTIYLPNDGVMGKTIFFKQWWKGYMRVYARSGQYLYDDSTPNTYFDIGEGQGAIFTFTIGYINNVKTEAWLFNRYKW